MSEIRMAEDVVPNARFRYNSTTYTIMSAVPAATDMWVVQKLVISGTFKRRTDKRTIPPTVHLSTTRILEMIGEEIAGHSIMDMRTVGSPGARARHKEVGRPILFGKRFVGV